MMSAGFGCIIWAGLPVSRLDGEVMFGFDVLVQWVAVSRKARDNSQATYLFGIQQSSKMPPPPTLG